MCHVRRRAVGSSNSQGKLALLLAMKKHEKVLVSKTWTPIQILKVHTLIMATVLREQGRSIMGLTVFGGMASFSPFVAKDCAVTWTF